MLQRGYCCNHLDTLLSLYENDLMYIIYQISTKNFKIINDSFIFMTIFFFLKMIVVFGLCLYALN